MNEFNYWDIPLAALPSRGKEYQESATIKFRCLNVRDLKFLAAINEKNARKMVNSILERCLLIENLEFDDILEGDRLTLVFYLRTNTFQLSNSYQTEFVCPYCRSRVSSEFKMSSLHVKNIDESVLRSIYIGDVKISGVHRKISDKKYVSNDHDIENILNWTDVSDHFDNENIESDILGLPADLFSKLKHLAEDAMFGIESWTNLICTDCGRELRVGVDIRDINLFNRVNTITMIRNQIQVSKYCGVVINDDMPYNEVELLIATVNDMAQKESENLKKGSKPKGVSR